MIKNIFSTNFLSLYFLYPKVCAALVAGGTCPKCACLNTTGPQVWRSGNCPVENHCTRENYHQYVDSIKSDICPKLVSGTHYESWMFCMVTNEPTLFLPQTVRFSKSAYFPRFNRWIVLSGLDAEGIAVV